MARIATIIPTYKRSHLLEEFIKNHDKNSTESTLYFVITPEDVLGREVLTKLHQSFFVTDSEYVGAINHGFKNTSEEFVLCAADDVSFIEGWDTELLKLTEDPTKHIFGGVDEWQISRTLKHISHPLVRRSHFKDPLYCPDYIHYMCDIEFVQRGFQEGCVSITPQILIQHPHTVTVGQNHSEWDETYRRSFSKIEFDRNLYLRRRKQFEMYEFEELQECRVIPTKLNPEYADTLISIVIPTYNDADFLMPCLESLAKNTFYRYEIIIIDNGSDPLQKTAKPWELIDTNKLLDSIVLEDSTCELKIIRHEKNVWVNPVWNEGASIAKGKYIAIINADISVSEGWDKYLVSALESPIRKFTVACPYEKNPYNKEAYALDKFFMKNMPHMLKGPCFMFRQSDVKHLFPIPPQLKHWCGDNWIADQSARMDGTVFAKKALIFHWITQSGNRVGKYTLLTRTYKDVLAYEKLTGKNMDFIKKTFPQSIRDFCLADDHE